MVACQRRPESSGNSARKEKDRSVTFDDSGGRKTLIDALKVSMAAFLVLFTLWIVGQFGGTLETMWRVGQFACFYSLLLLLVLIGSLLEETNDEQMIHSEKTSDEQMIHSEKTNVLISVGGKIFWEIFCFVIKTLWRIFCFPIKEFAIVLTQCANRLIDNLRRILECTPENMAQAPKNDHTGDDQCPSPPGKKLPHVETVQSSSTPDDLDGARESTQGSTSTIASIGAGENEGGAIRCQNTPETFGKDPSAVRLRPNGLVILAGHPGGLKENRNEFANYHIKARPICLSKTLYPLYDSIGCLECGDVQATCFLISSDIIATNWHVVDKIEKARRSSTHVDHNDVFVYFHYEKFGEKSFRCQLMPLRSEGNIMSKDFDYAFLHLQQPHFCSKLNKLGKRVRCKVPDFGNTCIVAHPNGKEKQEELVPILPLHENRRYLELERRLAEKKQECIENPSECTLTHNGSECIHMYNSKLLELYRNEYVMTYDVGSMFEGSSGAPVFDMNGYIVALHTRGFRLEDSSVVEVGMTFKTIINDLLARNLHDFVQTNFPSCWEENMDED